MANIAIVGARGYAGRELLRLLHQHPNIERIVPISGTTANEPVGEHIAGMEHLDLQFESSEGLANVDAVFLATNDDVAMETVAGLDAKQLVIDLSRAHRQEGLAPGYAWSYGWADLHFPEANESVRAYRVEGHDHGDEIRSATMCMTNRSSTSVRFTPHLVPQTRGLLTTCYLPANGDVDAVELREYVEEFYRDAPFVHVVDEPDTSAVRGSNHAHVAIHYDAENRLFVARCAIDNLQKGAAGTAVQNFNLAMGWTPTLGLEALAA